MTGDFTNKNVVITGGTSGIGAATSHAFGSRGARILVADRQAADR